MAGETLRRPYEGWLDLVKLFACILVALGHLLQSFVSSGIMQSTPNVQRFLEVIYYFHVPLFFLCSGYLHKKSPAVRSLKSYGCHVLRKLIALGVPYLVFSFLTWLMKVFAAGSVNTSTDGLLNTLLAKPLSPYWYLYILFFMFLITPTFRKTWGVLVAMVLAVGLRITGSKVDTGIYLVEKLMENELWFVLGMVLASVDITRFIRKYWSIPAGSLLVAAFLWAALRESRPVPLYVMTASMLLGICLLAMSVTRYPAKFAVTGRITLAVFLMHTLFAAPVRIALQKIGVESTGVHMACGILASFACPIVASFIMSKTKYLDFLLYPGKYWKPFAGKIRKEC